MRKVWDCSLRWRWLRCLSLLLVSLTLLSSISIVSNASEVSVISDTEEYVEVVVEFPLNEEIDIQCGNTEYTTQLTATGQITYTLPQKGSYLITKIVQIGSGFQYDWSTFDCGTNDTISSMGLAQFEYNKEAFDYGGENLTFTATTNYRLTIQPDVWGYVNNLKVYGVRGTIDRLQTGTFRIYYKQVENYTEGQKLDTIDGTLQEQHETQKGILGKITEFFGSFFDNLIDTVIGLIVPSAEDLKVILDEFDTFFEETFGFLYYPFDVFADLIDIFINTKTSNVELTLPGFSIMGYQVWEDQTYNLTNFMMTFTYGNLLRKIQQVTGMLLVGMFVMYLGKFFKDHFGGGNG